MNISIVCGNQRNGQSQKVMSYLKSLCLETGLVNINCIDLFNRNIKAWDESVWKLGKDWDSNWNQTSDELKASDGLIVISPEYGGMVPPILKNFFLLCSQNELAHKPGLLVGVSSTRNGAYPIAELRSSSYKNNKICYIPDHVIMRDVEKFLADPAGAEFAYLHERTKYSINIFKFYVQAFKEIRKQEVVFLPKYKFGM